MSGCFSLICLHPTPRAILWLRRVQVQTLQPQSMLSSQQSVCLSVLGSTSTAQCCEGGSHHRFISVRSLPVLLGPPLPDKQPCRAVHHPFERSHRFTQQNQKTNWQPWISLSKGPSRVNTKAIPILKNLSPPPCRSYGKLL